MATVDYFLKLNGIEGESSDDKHKNEIEIESWSWGLSNSGTAHSSTGAGAGKAIHQDIHFTSKLSKASPKLALSCATGEHVTEGTLTCRKAGGDQQEYLTIKLNDVYVSSYQTGGSNGNIVPMDQFSLNFAKWEEVYKQQDAKGAVGQPVKVGYNIAANKKI